MYKNLKLLTSLARVIIITCSGVDRANATIEGLEAGFSANARLMISGSGFESSMMTIPVVIAGLPHTNLLAQWALLHGKHTFKTTGMSTVCIHQFPLFTQIILAATNGALLLAFTSSY